MRFKLKSGNGSKDLFGNFSEMEQLKNEILFYTSFSSDTIYRLKYDGMIYEYISPSVEKLLGFSKEELEKINLRTLISETNIVADEMEQINSFQKFEENRELGNINKWQADYLMRRKDGTKVWVSDISYPWFDKKGKIIGSIGCLRDISERVEAEKHTREKLAQLINNDSLTGLANRRIFFSSLENELVRKKRSKQDISVLLIDIDRLKRINDEYGDTVGDKVILDTANIIKDCLRETDIVARLGGEEFGVILPDTPAKGAYWVAERIRSKVSRNNITLGNKILPIGSTVSIGVAGAENNQNIDASGLCKLADARLSIAKEAGQNQVYMDEVVHMD